MPASTMYHLQREATKAVAKRNCFEVNRRQGVLRVHQVSLSTMHGWVWKGATRQTKEAERTETVVLPCVQGCKYRSEQISSPDIEAVQCRASPQAAIQHRPQRGHTWHSNKFSHASRRVRSFGQESCSKHTCQCGVLTQRNCSYSSPSINISNCNNSGGFNEYLRCTRPSTCTYR